jgi:hypothetical protein
VRRMQISKVYNDSSVSEGCRSEVHNDSSVCEGCRSKVYNDSSVSEGCRSKVYNEEDPLPLGPIRLPNTLPGSQGPTAFTTAAITPGYIETSYMYCMFLQHAVLLCTILIHWLKLLLHRIATFCLDFRHMCCLPDK